MPFIDCKILRLLQTLGSLEVRAENLAKELADVNKIVAQLEKDKNSQAQMISEKDEQIKHLRKYNEKSNSIIEELSRSIQKVILEKVIVFFKFKF